jgi:hypothetical protein
MFSLNFFTFLQALSSNTVILGIRAAALINLGGWNLVLIRFKGDLKLPQHFDIEHRTVSLASEVKSYNCVPVE